MKLEEARTQFIQAWGTLGSKWGINRSMAQVHALLMIAPEPMSTEDVMEQLAISRGSANMNLRDLMDWGLVEKIHKPGERMEFYSAEKDIWKIARQIAKERKKRELEPIVKLLEQLGKVEGDKKDKKVKAFTDTITGIQRMANNADKTLETMMKAEENWFFGGIIKLFK